MQYMILNWILYSKGKKGKNDIIGLIDKIWNMDGRLKYGINVKSPRIDNCIHCVCKGMYVGIKGHDVCNLLSSGQKKMCVYVCYLFETTSVRAKGAKH